MLYVKWTVHAGDTKYARGLGSAKSHRISAVKSYDGPIESFHDARTSEPAAAHMPSPIAVVSLATARAERLNE